MYYKHRAANLPTRGASVHPQNLRQRTTYDNEYKINWGKTLKGKKKWNKTTSRRWEKLNLLKDWNRECGRIHEINPKANSKTPIISINFQLQILEQRVFVAFIHFATHDFHSLNPQTKKGSFLLPKTTHQRQNSIPTLRPILSLEPTILLAQRMVPLLLSQVVR